jgi:ABC-type amino acid transport substrate-binding protein
MTRNDIEQQLRELDWPEPSDTLRERVVSTTVRLAQPVTWSDRMWYSRAWRLTACASVILIVVLDGLSSLPKQTGAIPATQARTDARAAAAQAIDETGREVGLPPDVAAALAQRAFVAPSRPQTPTDSDVKALSSFDIESTGGSR